ncbi:MAG TPA: hypothetical protein PLP23_19195 [Panacibacter sp.]|nr:hypothetical protein [Panacibacter sp.]
MKYIIVLLITLFPVFAMAQAPGDSLAIHAHARALEMLRASITKSTLGIYNTGTERNLDIREYNQFKNKFDLKATVADNFNVVYHYNAKTDSVEYVIDPKVKAFDVYTHDVALKIKSIKFDPDPKIELVSDATNFTNMVYRVYRQIKFEMPRQYIIEDNADYVNSVFQGKNKKAPIHFEKNDGSLDSLKKNFENKLENAKDSIYQFSVTETLLISVAYSMNDSVKITGITNEKSPELNILNDSDNDIVLNNEEADPRKNRGEFTAKGLPDADLDGMPDIRDKCKYVYTNDTSLNQGCPESYFISHEAIEGFIGIQLNAAKINLPELDNLGYTTDNGKDAMDVLQSKKGVLKNPGLIAGVSGGLNFTHYFGQRKQSGISAGVNFSRFNADYQLASPIVYTFKSNDGFNDYRRQIAIDSLKEKITYNIFNFPVMFNYRLKTGNMYKQGEKNPKDKKDKMVINVKAGPSLMLFSATSDYDAFINFGGIYQTNGDQLIYDDFFDESLTSNVFITADSIKFQNSNPGADAVFNQLNANSGNYDFANNKNYKGRQKNTTRAAIALNLAFDAQFSISKNSPLVFKAGGHLTYAPLPERKEKYMPVNRTSDPFQSVYNSNAKTSYSAFGINLGFVYNFNFKK